MIKKHFNALYADDGLLFFDEDSGNVTFCGNEMGILSVNFNIYLDYYFDEDDPNTIILARLLAWHREELMAIAWHTKRWCIFFHFRR